MPTKFPFKISILRVLGLGGHSQLGFLQQLAPLKVLRLYLVQGNDYPQQDRYDMRPESLILRCYAEKDGDLWVAVCIDLCLAAQGQTVQQAREKLHLQIYDYLYDALAGLDQDHAGYLLKRKAPLGQVAKYHLLRAMSAVHVLREGAYSLFSEVCPVTLKQA